jgi:hypothetical protein
MMQSELIHWIGAKVAETVNCNCGLGTTWPKNRGFMSGLGYNPGKTEGVWFLGRS